MSNKAGKRVRCDVCGAEVIVSRGGSGTVECCSKPMTER